MAKKNLQLFASGDNNNQAVRSYSKQFKELLQAVFGVQAYFGDFFAGGLEAIDGITQKDKAFSVKTSDVACVITTGTLTGNSPDPAYDTGANVGFGTGTGKSSRFGQRTEVVYVDTDVDYTWDWVVHEGIDRHTVNADFDDAVADRLDLQAQEKVGVFNAKHGAFISAAAGKTVTKSGLTEANVIAAFNELHKYYVDIGAKGTPVAKVTPDVNNIIVDSSLATTAKGSTVNIDREEVTMFKGFVIEEIPSSLFQTNEYVYAYIPNIGKAFTGIETTRTIESEDFDGVALQGAGKAGEWVSNDNKAAIAKMVF